MILTNQIKNEIKLHAKEESPRECCGFIVDKIGAYKAKNISQEKNNSMRDNSFSQFDPSLTTFHKYIGREFKIGETDCWQLVKDFYEDELNIKFKEYYRDKTYKSYLGKLFNLGMKTSGFYFVDQLQKYDCLLFGKETPFHIGVYLGGDLILHQPPNSYSRVEDYTEKHRKITKHIIRHHEFN